MNINSINNQLKIIQNPLEQNKKPQGNKFENVLSSFVSQVKESEAESAKLTQDFILGEDVEIHEVMIAAEKAKTDLMLLTEIRNKVLDTYNELTKIQI